MALTPNQVITLKRDIFAWATPDTSQQPYGKYGAGVKVTVIAQTGNVVQVRSTLKPAGIK